MSTENMIEQKHSVYKEIWKRLSIEGRENVATKAQRQVSYCNMIAKANNAAGASKDTIYDLCQFASEEFESEYKSLKQQIRKVKTPPRKTK